MALLRTAVLAGLVAGPLAGPLAGCVSWTSEPPATVAPVRTDPVEIRLVEAVERAERALASLARTLPAPDPGSRLPARLRASGRHPCSSPPRDVYVTPVSEGASSGTLERISTWSMRRPRKARQAAVSASVS